MMSTKDYSSKQENMIADLLGWRVVSGSGSRPLHPGDIVSNEFLGECKTHTEVSDSIVFKLNEWEKIKGEAVSQFKSAVLFVDDGSQEVLNTWCVFNLLPSGNYIFRELPIKCNKSIRLNKKHIDDICQEILDTATDSEWSSKIVFRIPHWGGYLCSLSDFSQFFGS